MCGKIHFPHTWKTNFHTSGEVWKFIFQVCGKWKCEGKIHFPHTLLIKVCGKIHFPHTWKTNFHTSVLTRVCWKMTGKCKKAICSYYFPNLLYSNFYPCVRYLFSRFTWLETRVSRKRLQILEAFGLSNLPFSWHPSFQPREPGKQVTYTWKNFSYC